MHSNGWVYVKYLTTELKNLVETLLSISYIPCYTQYFVGRVLTFFILNYLYIKIKL
jgi:hypothetical protein